MLKLGGYLGLWRKWNFILSKVGTLVEASSGMLGVSRGMLGASKGMLG